MQPNPMRSTGFFIVSLVIHGLAFAAIMVTPIHTVSDAGDRLEVTVGDAADKAGVKEAPQTEAESKPEVVAPQEAAVPAAAPAPAPKAVVKATPKPVAPKAAAPKPAIAKAVAKTVPAKAAPVKVITQAVDPEDTTAPAAPVAETPVADKTEETQEKEETPVLTPVKETAPAGVEASTDEVPEAKAEEKPEPVAAVAQPAAAPVAAAATAVTKGGATKEGAVAYTSLKQMPGNKPPTYPMQARLENRQGNVELRYRVTSEGKVEDISVAKSSGSKDLDDSAVKAISQFKFYPGQEGWARHPVNFNLKGAVAALPSKLRANKSKTADAD